MSTDNQKQTSSQLQHSIATSLSKALGIPVYAVNDDLVDQIVGQARQLPEIDSKDTLDELHSEVASWISTLIVSRPSSEEEAQERIDSFFSTLETEKQYEATIVLPGIIGFPIGTKIGLLEIIEPKVNDKMLEEYLESMRDKKGVNADVLSHGKVVFQAYTTTRVRDVLEEKLELPFSILSLITHLDLSARNCAGIITSPDSSTIYFLEPQNKLHGWSRYSPKHHAELLRRLSDISLEPRPNQLQQKILRALRIFGLSRLSHRAEVRFLLIVSSFESLLLSESDRDYLGKGLAEKTAFLLESDYEQRQNLFKLMKKFYGERSALVHRGTTSISNTDVQTIEYIFTRVAIRILELSEKYSKMEQKSHDKDKEGLEDYINRLRFS